MRGRVLVTGAAGFIGSHLVETLVRSGAEVTALVHYNSRDDRGNLEHLPRDLLAAIKVLRGDVRDAYFMRSAMHNMDTVFHLAALIAIPYSYRAPAAYVDTNVIGTLNVLQAARDSGVQRLVHTSTSEVYGTARYVPIDEDHPLQAQSPYAASKIAADKLAESFHLSFGLPVVTVRPFNTFGPRQSRRAVLATIVSQVLAGGPVRLGNLDPVRDLCFVTDTAQGFVLAAQSAEAIGSVINLGTGRGVRIGELAEAVFEVAGRRAEIHQEDQRFRPDASEVMRLIASWSRAEKLLGWAPRVSLRDGLAATVDWFRAHPPAAVSEYAI
jgi:NAD dependent epimerase/dehydratase